MAKRSSSLVMGNQSSRVINRFDEINTRARNIFKSAKKLGLTQNITELKRKAIDIAISEKGVLDYDKDHYLADYSRRVQLLVGNRFFNSKCESMGLSPFSAATHLVFLGSKKLKEILIDDILEYGVPQFDYYPDWSNPIFEESDLIKRYTAIAQITSSTQVE